MIKNIIFDFGNVLLKGRGISILDPYTDDENIKNIISKKIFKSEDWHNYDLGYISTDILYEKLTKTFPEEFHNIIKLALYDSPKSRIYNEEICQIIKKLKDNGYKIYALSNINTKVYNNIKKSEIGKYFDGYIISSIEHVAKPDKKIYIRLFEKFNILPEESFFIDDKEKNIVAANNLNMPGHMLDIDKDGVTKLKEDFEKYNINYK